MISYSYSHIGKRQNQEDAFKVSEGLYFVCDGVGGHSKGEIASNFIAAFILENLPATTNKMSIESLLEDAQAALNLQYGDNAETTGMGTTFCGIFFTTDSAYMAYIGDSRIYWLKPEINKIWHTWDHSLVGELMRSGEITREEGRLHPMGNRISKAIIANDKNKITVPDIIRIDFIEKGDLFLLCSDGVTECWPEKELIALLLSNTLDTSEKLNNIRIRGEANSKDNNTAILLEVQSDDVIYTGNNEEINWLSPENFDTATAISQPYIAKNGDKANNATFNKKRISTILLLIITVVIAFKLTEYVQIKKEIRYSVPNLPSPKKQKIIIINTRPIRNINSKVAPKRVGKAIVKATSKKSKNDSLYVTPDAEKFESTTPSAEAIPIDTTKIK